MFSNRLDKYWTYTGQILNDLRYYCIYWDTNPNEYFLLDIIPLMLSNLKIMVVIHIYSGLYLYKTTNIRTFALGIV